MALSLLSTVAPVAPVAQAAQITPVITAASKGSIIAFLGSMGPYAPLFVFFAGILGILVIYMIASFVGKPMNLKLGPLALAMGDKDGQIPEKKYDKRYLVEKTKNIVEKSVEEQKTIEAETIQRQLNFARERIIEINSIMTNAYAVKLAEKIGEANVRSSTDYRNYRLVVQMMTNECIKERVLVKALKENHLTAMNGAAWDDFLKQKVDVTIAMLSEYLDLMYNGTNITRQEVSELNDDTRRQVSQMITSIYEAARNISESDQVNIKRIKEKTSEELGKLT
jgi:hypothetical protein